MPRKSDRGRWARVPRAAFRVPGVPEGSVRRVHVWSCLVESDVVTSFRESSGTGRQISSSCAGFLP